MCRCTSESTAFLGTLWVLSAQSVSRKAVDLGHSSSSTLQPLTLDQACWYLNKTESSFHEEFKYVIITRIHGSTAITVFGTQRVHIQEHCKEVRQKKILMFPVT